MRCIVGVSLLGRATMKFWPYPHVPWASAGVYRLELPPGSIYVIEGPARWRWQHGTAATAETR